MEEHVCNLLHLYWILAVASLALRYFSVQFRAWCSYGKAAFLYNSQSLATSRWRKFRITRPLCFTMFYLTGLLFSCSALAWSQITFASPRNTTALAILAFHCARRMLETLIWHRSTRSPNVGLVQSFAGASFYIATPLSYFLSNPFFYAGEEIIYASNVCWGALSLCMTCQAAQSYAHHQLYLLRKIDSSSPAYALPTFRYIIFPHYTCETIFYFILTLCNVQRGTLCYFPALFTAINLGLTAREQYEWYESHYGKMQLPRWKMFPLVY